MAVLCCRRASLGNSHGPQQGQTKGTSKGPGSVLKGHRERENQLKSEVGKLLSTSGKSSENV